MNKVKTLFLSIIISLAVAAIAFAWTNPTANPPGGGGALYYSGGNVGIGTTSPGARLEVEADSGLPMKIKATGTNWAALDLAKGTVVWRVQSDGSKFYITETGVASHLVILPTSGNVGIGTTEPGQKLSVVGTAGANDMFDVASSTGTSV